MVGDQLRPLLPRCLLVRLRAVGELHVGVATEALPRNRVGGHGDDLVVGVLVGQFDVDGVDVVGGARPAEERTLRFGEVLPGADRFELDEVVELLAHARAEARVLALDVVAEQLAAALADVAGADRSRVHGRIGAVG